MWVEMIKILCTIKEGDYDGDDYSYDDPVTLTRVKIEYPRMPKGFEEETIKEKITKVFGKCDDFSINPFPGGFVFSYIEKYPAGTDDFSVFPEERHVYQGLFEVFEINL